MNPLKISGVALILMCGAAHANNKEVVDVRGTRPIEIHGEAGGTTPVKTMSPTEFKASCLPTPQKILKEQIDPVRGPYLQLQCQGEALWVRAFQMQLKAEGAPDVKCDDVVIADAKLRQKITETGGGRGLGSGVCGEKK